MRKFTTTLIALAMLLAACSGGATQETTTTTEPTTTTTESTTTTTTTTIPPTTTTTVPPTTTTTVPPTTTTTVPQDNPCRVLLKTTKELKGKAPERMECLTWFGNSFNKVYPPALSMLGYKLYYEGPVEQNDVLPELTEDVPAVVYLLQVHSSDENAKQKVLKAMCDIAATNYALSDKLGIDEIYMRMFFSKDTYIDVYVAVEELRKLPQNPSCHDISGALIVTAGIDSEEQNISEETVPEENN